jgi:predicted N-formylglutamate amidohydrolase
MVRAYRCRCKPVTNLLHPDEPAPYHIIVGAPASPWVLTCDHASNRIPRALGTLGLPAGEIDRHIGWDIGAAAVTVGLAARLGAWAILQNYSRLVIDCNRPPGVASSIPVRSENTDIPGNVGLSGQQTAQRRAAIFDPYHAAIETELNRRASLNEARCFVAVHSFTPIYDSVARPMHAAVLYNRDNRLAHALGDLLRSEPGLIIGDNEPYNVSDETDYGVPVHAELRSLPYVELEIRQDLIATPPGQSEWIDRLSRLLPVAMEKGRPGALPLDPAGA